MATDIETLRARHNRRARGAFTHRLPPVMNEWIDGFGQVMVEFDRNRQYREIVRRSESVLHNISVQVQNGQGQLMQVMNVPVNVPPAPCELIHLDTASLTDLLAEVSRRLADVSGDGDWELGYVVRNKEG